MRAPPPTLAFHWSERICVYHKCDPTLNPKIAPLIGQAGVEQCNPHFPFVDVVTIKPIGGAECYLNGGLISNATELHSGDRVILGKNHVFRFNNPLTRKFPPLLFC